MKLILRDAETEKPPLYRTKAEVETQNDSNASRASFSLFQAACGGCAMLVVLQLFSVGR